MIPKSVTLARQLQPAKWVMSCLPRANVQQIADLATFMPSGFAAYLRVLHPAASRPPWSGPADPAEAIRWADLADANGVRLHAEIAFQQILSPSELSHRGELEPMSGALVPESCAALVSLLGGHTATAAACWFCLWEGNAGLWDQAKSQADPAAASGKQTGGDTTIPSIQDDLLASYPKVDMGSRRYFLGHGPLGAACLLYDEIGASPNIWWPEDHAWIVVTEVDSYSTYVGCDRAAAGDILASPDLESIEVDLGVRI